MAAVGTRGRADATRGKPGSDAYVGLLGISLLALATAMLFAFLNWNQISATPKAVQMAPVGGGGGRMPAAPGTQPNMPPPPGTPGPGVAQPNVPPVPGQQPGGNVPPPPQQQQKK